MAEDKLRIERGEMPETLLEIMQKRAVRPPCLWSSPPFINRLMPAYRGMINKLSADLLIIAVYRQVTAYQ